MHFFWGVLVHRPVRVKTLLPYINFYRYMIYLVTEVWNFHSRLVTFEKHLCKCRWCRIEKAGVPGSKMPGARKFAGRTGSFCLVQNDPSGKFTLFEHHVEWTTRFACHLHIFFFNYIYLIRRYSGTMWYLAWKFSFDMVDLAADGKTCVGLYWVTCLQLGSSWSCDLHSHSAPIALFLCPARNSKGVDHSRSSKTQWICICLIRFIKCDANHAIQTVCIVFQGWTLGPRAGWVVIDEFTQPILRSPLTRTHEQFHV